MTAENDLDDEMRGFLLDNHTEDRILAGVVAPEDAPPDLAHLAQAVREAQGPGTEGELANQTQIVAAFLSAIDPNPALRPLPTPRRPMLVRLLSTKVAALPSSARCHGNERHRRSRKWPRRPRCGLHRSTDR